MVTTDNGNGARNFYMVASDTPEGAVAAVNGQMKTNNAVALAPVSDETLAHFSTTPASIWLCCTMDERTGKLTSSQFKDGPVGGRGVVHPGSGNSPA
jgi:hypothetical protein